MSSYKEQREKYLSKVLAMHRAGVPKGEILKEVPITRRTMDRWIEQYAFKKRTAKQYSSEKRKKYYDDVINSSSRRCCRCVTIFPESEGLS